MDTREAYQPQEIVYREGTLLSVGAIVWLYQQAELDRPTKDPDRIGRMYDGSNLLLTAWDKGELVGILRGWSDGGYLGYIADLAVLLQYQPRGIGRQLLQRAVEANRDVQFVLRAAPTASEYYAHIGCIQVENGWYCPRKESLPHFDLSLPARCSGRHVRPGKLSGLLLVRHRTSA